MKRELEFLDEPQRPVPEQLPKCAAAVTRRIQLEILREELPGVADAVEHDLADGSDPRGPGAHFQLSMKQAREASQGADLAPREIVKLFKNCRIGNERVVDEVGTDLLTKVVSRTVAVTVTAGAGEHAKLGLVRRLFQTARPAAIGFDFLAQSIVKQSRTAVALFTAALCLGAALIGLDFVFKDDLPVIVRSVGAVLLVAACGVAFLRHTWWAVTIVVLGGLALLLGADWGRISAVFSGGDPGVWRKVVSLLLFFGLVMVLAYNASRGPLVSGKRGK